MYILLIALFPADHNVIKGRYVVCIEWVLFAYGSLEMDRKEKVQLWFTDK